MRRALMLGGVAYIIALHIIAVLAFFAPHLLPYQGWRLDLPPSEPTAYVTQRHRHIVWQDKHSGTGAVALLGASHFEAMDPSLLGRPVLKYAAGGDTIRNTAERVLDYPNLANASVIIVWVGFNDTVHREPEEIVADFPKLLERLPANVPIITLAQAPTTRADKQADIAALNAGYRPLCEADLRCQFLDIVPLLAAPDGSLAPHYDRGDGVHLNRAGYVALAEAIKPLLPDQES
ncbi:GDSL-type esterase/lipase family protein [Pontixanthobacter aestiaquae]|uniref:SGNH hydrolase-type esterase domain-containing protein n=1 Tax=Pontixanthobacter aestiaquae TaxID=1509367 RepID=A0A844Z6F0_9SPHN|nr:GDSL-type esterase/lipase family protein [Pontixanthobacter aestiaquae]MDN3646116.1 GDSL-type esterase/lipase family protein [Pontixanthobacter aestiaquae]MXO82892.1 hypothetical protein [Pontixanthobacter aestiaquae]